MSNGRVSPDCKIKTGLPTTPDCCMVPTITVNTEYKKNSVDPDQLASSEAS